MRRDQFSSPTAAAWARFAGGGGKAFRRRNEAAAEAPNPQFIQRFAGEA